MTARPAAVLVALFGAFLWSGPLADAQERAPADVADAAGVALGPLPAGYVSARRGRAVWAFPRRARDSIEELMDVYRDAWPRLETELGGVVSSAVTIRVGRDPEDMARLAPASAPPPAYAVGVTYPHLGLILLTLSAPNTWERPDLETVLVHELSHLALHRAVRGRDLPRWFVEGVAIHQASEHSVGRIRTLWEGTVRGALLPLSRLSDSFPKRPHAVGLAYAQSADAVAFLRERDEEGERFRELVAELRGGTESFDRAVRKVYGVSLGAIEREWHEDLRERYRTVPLLISGGGFWGVAVLLLLVAYVRRRHANSKALRRWQEEEAAVDQLKQAVARDSGRDLPQSMPVPVELQAPGEQARVPTIEHEGRSHTLH